MKENNMIRIYCFNDVIFNRVMDMWINISKPKKMMLKRFIKVNSFNVEGIKGVDITVISDLFDVSDMVAKIKHSLEDENFTSKDYKVVVVKNE
jgi:hypothetical protein